mgnify:CR=1 FL=1
MKRYTTYEEMACAIANKQDINGNSVTALMAVDNYIVKSYNTTMLIIDKNNIACINVKKYSCTTTKIQNIICNYYGIDLNKQRKRGDSVLINNNGKIIAEGTMQEVHDRYIKLLLIAKGV